MSDTPIHDQVSNGDNPEQPVELTPLDRLALLETAVQELAAARITAAETVTQVAFANRHTMKKHTDFAIVMSELVEVMEKDVNHNLDILQKGIMGVRDSVEEMRHVVNRQGMMLEILFHNAEVDDPAIRQRVSDKWDAYDQKQKESTHECLVCNRVHPDAVTAENVAERVEKLMGDIVGKDASLNISDDGLTVLNPDGSTVPLSDWLDQKTDELREKTDGSSVSVHVFQKAKPNGSHSSGSGDVAAHDEPERAPGE